jgi:hypothetical protein
MILRWQLEHKVNEKWEETPHAIKLEIPDLAYPFLKLTEMVAAFEGVLELAGCEDRSINYQHLRVVFYSQMGSQTVRGIKLKK